MSLVDLCYTFAQSEVLNADRSGYLRHRIRQSLCRRLGAGIPALQAHLPIRVAPGLSAAGREYIRRLYITPAFSCTLLQFVYTTQLYSPRYCTDGSKPHIWKCCYSGIHSVLPLPGTHIPYRYYTIAQLYSLRYCTGVQLYSLRYCTGVGKESRRSRSRVFRQCCTAAHCEYSTAVYVARHYITHTPSSTHSTCSGCSVVLLSGA